MLPKKQFSRIGLMMMLATLILNGIQYLSIAVCKQVPVIIASQDLTLIVGMLPSYLIGYPIIFLLFKMIPIQMEGEPKKMCFSHILVAFVMAYSLTHVCNTIGNFIINIVEEYKGADVQNVLQVLLSDVSPLTTLIIAVILAPIFEELLFRKTVIDRTVKYGEGISIVFSGLLFGLFHGNFSQFAYAMFLGMFFGFIYIKTKNIVNSIILHALTNFMGSMAPILLMKNTRYLEYEEKLAVLRNSPDFTEAAGINLALDYAGDIMIVFCYLVLMFTLIITGVILLIVKRKTFILEPGEITIEKGTLFRTVCLNPGVLIFILFWVVMIIRQLFL